MNHHRLHLLLVAALVAGSAGAEPHGDPFPPELVRFKSYPKNPVFTAGGQGAWDAHIRERGWVLKEGDTWKLWYTGYASKEGRRMLGYATSPDGIRWTRDPRNPIHKDHWVEDVMVVKDGDRYLLFAEGEQDRAHWMTSADGITWQEQGRLDVRKVDGSPIPHGPYGTPTVWKGKDAWFLFYEREDKGVWLAKSRDLKVWTHVRDEPVLSPGPGAYDHDLIAVNQVIEYRGRYYVYYHGSARTGPRAKLWSTAVATSTDLVHWEKYPNNPLFPVEANVSSGIVVPDRGRFRLYTMHPDVRLYLPAE